VYVALAIDTIRPMPATAAATIEMIRAVSALLSVQEDRAARAAGVGHAFDDRSSSRSPRR
jgi:hypothetical protein